MRQPLQTVQKYAMLRKPPYVRPRTPLIGLFFMQRALHMIQFFYNIGKNRSKTTGKPLPN